MPLTYNDGGLPAKITRLIQSDSLVRGLRAGALYLHGKLAYYPPVNRRPQAQFWTPAQRRGFFYHLKEGNIEVPYRRGSSPSSERMRERWVQKSTRGGYSQVLENNTSYGGLVIGSKQTEYHAQGGWRTAEDTVKDEAQEVVNIVANEIGRDVRS